MTEPSAYEIAEAWTGVDDAVKEYWRHTEAWRYMHADALERRFATLARLLDRAKEHGT